MKNFYVSIDGAGVITLDEKYNNFDVIGEALKDYDDYIMQFFSNTENDWSKHQKVFDLLWDVRAKEIIQHLEDKDFDPVWC